MRMRREQAIVRRLPVGAELQPGGGVSFRVWAPRRRRVHVVTGDGEAHPLEAERDGHHAGFVAEARAGTLYRYRLDDAGEFPDPASRFQPEGPHGPSQVIDPDAYRWADAAWGGPRLEGLVLYEMHVGTFTREGTWEGALRELPRLADDGIGAIELMPVADFCGRFGWGYDGVDLFAPTRLYGTPDDMRRFVDRAHALDIAVLLDVVYNHFGPDGAYHRQFSEQWHSSRYRNEWGEPLNFDGDGCAAVREFVIANAACWIRELHLDGLRLDATQQMFDASPVHILDDLTRAVRVAGGERSTRVIAENEPQDARLVRPRERGGLGMDAVWNDDFHRAATSAATGRNEAYFSDYLGAAQELVSAAKYGFLYQGQRFAWQKKPRGTPAFDLPPAAFVNFLQNHDQVANSATGLRLNALTSPGRLRALTALLLLGPGTPMLFQGEEFGASSPFLFFADHKPELAAQVRRGRAEFLSQFPGIGAGSGAEPLADPSDPATFERCKLDLGERETHASIHALHRDLLHLRRTEAAFRMQRRGALDGAVLSPEAFVLRFFVEAGEDRLLVVNLGRDIALSPAPQPLVAPIEGTTWEILWSSEDVRYGGSGAAPLEDGEGWRVPGHAAVVLIPRRNP